MLDLVKLEKGKLTIQISVKDLPKIVEASWASGGFDTRFKVTDATAFAEDLARALCHEEEDGTTFVHKMFDEAIEYAIEYGAEGIEEHPDQDA
jgi:hypothetical protein